MTTAHFDLQATPDQISGVRDRPDAIDPTKMHATFIDALTKTHPELVAEEGRLDRVRSEAAMAAHPHHVLLKQLQQLEEQKSKKRKKHEQQEQRPSMWDTLVSESKLPKTEGSGFSFGF